jgi:hypothetical protein
MIVKEHDAMHSIVIEAGENLIIRFDEFAAPTVVEPW